jgi:hypothetical protein
MFCDAGPLGAEVGAASSRDSAALLAVTAPVIRNAGATARRKRDSFPFDNNRGISFMLCFGEGIGLGTDSAWWARVLGTFY